MLSVSEPSPTGRTVHRLGPGGVVRDWLVSQVAEEPASDLAEYVDPTGDPWTSTDQRFARWVLTNGPDVAELKERLLADRGPELACDPTAIAVGTAVAEPDHDLGSWERRHVLTDGFVDESKFCFVPTYRTFLAATVLEVDQPEWRTLYVDSTGPVRMWVDDALVLDSTTVSYMDPVTSSCRVRLPSGRSSVIIASWQVAFREVRQIIRLRVQGLPVRVVIPQPDADEYLAAVTEQVLDAVGSTSWALGGPEHDQVSLIGPAGAALQVRADAREWRSIRLDEQGRAKVTLDQSDPVDDPDDQASASMLATGETRLAVRVDDPASPLERWMRVSSLPQGYRGVPQGTPAQWRTEVLQHVAARVGHTARSLASCALDAEAQVDPADLQAALQLIRERGDCADFEIVGLLLLWRAVPADRWPRGLRDQVQQALVEMKYWIDQPGLDAMCYFTENHQFVWHVAERLAGSTFPDEVFSNDGRTGAEHAAQAKERAAGWIRRKLDGGFSEFDSNAYLAIDALSLVALIELEPDPDLRDAATALLDFTLMTLCSNAWRGIHGTAHGRSYVPTLRSARTEETSPLLRLIAGVGTLNAAVLPVTALATARRYVVPEVCRRLAAEPPEQWWGEQVYRGDLAFERDLLARPYGSHLCVWQTPNTALSSVQDYRPGLPGLQEHVAGATLGPELQVFITWPANDDTGASARPNAWAGQRTLPRARQDRDVVLIVYDDPGELPAGVAGQPHLWLPLAQCSAVVRDGTWIAGQVGAGAVAVACAGGSTAMTAGEGAEQEHRPRGDGLAWVIVTADEVDDLANWVESLAAPDFSEGVRWTHPDGRQMRLTVRGPFEVNGRCADLGESGVPKTPLRLHNPAVTLAFGQAELSCRWGEATLQLDLATGRRLPQTDVEPVPLLPGQAAAAEPIAAGE